MELWGQVVFKDGSQLIRYKLADVVHCRYLVFPGELTGFFKIRQEQPVYKVVYCRGIGCGDIYLLI